MNEHLRVIITIVKVSVDLLYICGELRMHSTFTPCSTVIDYSTIFLDYCWHPAAAT